MQIKNLCVFTGSNHGALSEYTNIARQLGEALVKCDIGLVYGGGNVGLMGELANAMLEKKGSVIGIIPQLLYDKEVAHEQITQLHIVNSMHERKALMANLSDGFIAMPGGIGTLEEIFEVWTWQKLGFHNKPCGFLNVNNYFGYLFTFIDHMMEQKFLEERIFNSLLVEDKPSRLIESFQNYNPFKYT